MSPDGPMFQRRRGRTLRDGPTRLHSNPPAPESSYCLFETQDEKNPTIERIADITSARKLLTNRSYGVSYHLCSG